MRKNSSSVIHAVARLGASTRARAIVTQAYCGQFKWALAAGDVWRRSLARTAPIQSLAQYLSMIHAKKPLTLPKHPDQEKWWQHRRIAEQYAATKWQEAERARHVIKNIPWVQAIFVTGSLAMNSVTENDDIDFLIVTGKNRLWLVRLLVVVLAALSGKRRSWQGDEPNSWCFNLWLEVEQLAMPVQRQTIYEAYEVLQAKPVFERNGTLAKWYLANRWVGKWCPNWLASLSVESFSNVPSKGPITALAGLFDAINHLAYLLQRQYMQPHLTQEEVTPAAAFFHPRPTRLNIFQGWSRCVAQYNSLAATQLLSQLLAESPENV